MASTEKFWIQARGRVVCQHPTAGEDHEFVLSLLGVATVGAVKAMHARPIAIATRRHSRVLLFRFNAQIFSTSHSSSVA
jgi:hypothetical protein